MQLYDMHSHILPAFDDGAKTVEDSLALIDCLKKQGVRNICLTPHFYTHEMGVEDFLFSRQEAFERFKPYIPDDVNIVLGAEVYVTHYLFNSNDLSGLTYGKSKYILTEFAYSSTFNDRTMQFLDILMRNHGLRPVIPHVERYEYLIDTKYLDSYNLINDVSINLLENKDYSEIIITLYNLARTSFYSRNFDVASELFQTIFNLLSMFDVSDLYMNSFLPEYNDILAYRAMLDFYRGEYICAKMNLHNVQNNGKPFTTIEEFVKFFLDASIRLEENNKDEAIKIFEKCISDFFAIGVTQEHRIVFMIYEFANFLEQKGFHKESESYIARGFKIAKENNLENYTKGKNSITLK